MRILKSKPDPYPRGEFLNAINTKLDAFIRDHCAMTDVSGYESRKRMTPERLAEVFAKVRCAWIRGDGTPVVKVEGMHPEERLR